MYAAGVGLGGMMQMHESKWGISVEEEIV